MLMLERPLSHYWTSPLNRTIVKKERKSFHQHLFTVWYHTLRARRVLTQPNNVPLRTRRALSLYEIYGVSALLIKANRWTVLVTFWFSMANRWTVLVTFWFSTANRWTVLVTFWFSTANRWTALVTFWFSADLEMLQFRVLKKHWKEFRGKKLKYEIKIKCDGISKCVYKA